MMKLFNIWCSKCSTERKVQKSWLKNKKGRLKKLGSPARTIDDIGFVHPSNVAPLIV